ncbi:DNA polymerase III subunit chi [Altericroceibacterium xinjiangense]|uniref:DNA polymerase III subunit chi n=1 Tax=Altericroceibacterium xinjiangense TaxID=762261 RepID=UPI000F7E98B0|nr:DNA polymerase III subunit chi [Altericroceibacterium xinjiangense]
MERVGFYLSGEKPVEQVVPLIARAAKRAGERLLVVARQEERLDSLDKALWEQCPEDFLAHGRAGQPHSARQPLLLSDKCEAENGARLIALADGEWRDEAEGFDRVLLFFEDAGREAARETWRRFSDRQDIRREFYEFQDGKWVHKA